MYTQTHQTHKIPPLSSKTRAMHITHTFTHAFSCDIPNFLQTRKLPKIHARNPTELFLLLLLSSSFSSSSSLFFSALPPSLLPPFRTPPSLRIPPISLLFSLLPSHSPFMLRYCCCCCCSSSSSSPSFVTQLLFPLHSYFDLKLIF
ncbi:hypothetical protein PIB30_083104 [Stylosanthes scabra]|uniref:Uncharacterized protein n=1 Tax=Stylosanthes scabra TaxID=79078 RepID=A0ABU6QRR9_9FABA|nr:hypothetical protein [Stylosanthes scabra]